MIYRGIFLERKKERKWDKENEREKFWKVKVLI